MAGPLKTEAVVLRSMRYGEADRILHLYTPQRGKVGAIAKGVRRARSRFGGRLEPFFRLDADPARGPQRPAHGDRRPRRSRATRGCASDAARARHRRARLRRGRAPVRRPPSRIPSVFNLLCNELALLDADPARADARQPARLPAQAAARRRPRAAARRVRLVRRARAPQRLLGRRGRRRVRGLRGGVVPARRGGARLPGRRARPAAGRGAAGRRRARCARPSARSPRRVEHHAARPLRARRSPG